LSKVYNKTTQSEDGDRLLRGGVDDG